jgi:hypothetical protein
MTQNRLFFSYGVAVTADAKSPTQASIPEMNIRWCRDPLPLAVFADAEMFLTAIRTDRTGHLLLAAEIGGDPTRVDHRFDVTRRRSVAKAAIHSDWSSW